jgi:thioredoxin
MNIINCIKLVIAGLLSLVFVACNSSAQNGAPVISQNQEEIVVVEEVVTEIPNVEETNNENKPVSITSDQYVQLVADFRKDKEWKFKGKKPCVVDFYADWCRPCKMMEPAFAKAAEKYAGKVNFYKINVDHNKDISSAYQITGIPTLFFCSADGKMTRVSGYLSEEQINEMVGTILGK